MVTEHSPIDNQISRSAAIVWCCLLPNLLVLTLAGFVWSSGLLGDWQPSGLQLLTSAETLQQVRDVVGIGGAFLSAVMLSLILVPNMLITVLVSGRGFYCRRSAFTWGVMVCLLLPAVTITMLSVLQPT